MHTSEQASKANISFFNESVTSKYEEISPHVKHPALKTLYQSIVEELFQHAHLRSAQPSILDLGAGEGSTTAAFLKLGGKVTAIDLSLSQVTELKRKCAHFGDALTVSNGEVFEVLANSTEQFDIVVSSSFLHHIPDYLRLIVLAIDHLAPGGQFMSFQDPLQYDRMSRINYWFSTASYFSWRVFRPDLLGGIRRRIRRSRGIYLADSEFDNGEYHITRNGVDENAICDLLRRLSFDCQLVKYFSTHSGVGQRLGCLLRMENTFAIIAKRLV